VLAFPPQLGYLAVLMQTEDFWAFVLWQVVDIVIRFFKCFVNGHIVKPTFGEHSPLSVGPDYLLIVVLFKQFCQ
jgi:hypothetical protein